MSYRNSALLMVAAALILSIACASLSTQYQPEGASGGYSETRLNADTYEVRFQANGFTRVEIASALLLRRAAELTLENGRRYFEVSDQRSLMRGEDPAYVATIRILATRTDHAADAVQVVRETETAAGGRLSATAREQLRVVSATE